MIERTLGSKLEKLAEGFPVVTVTGPRQSGKTTLCRMIFQDYNYVSLEAPDIRQFALEDPQYIVGTMTHTRDLAYSPHLQMTPFNCEIESTRRYLPPGSL